MKYLTLIALLCTLSFAQELKIKADSFKADQAKGISEFKGNVKIVKAEDILEASQVTIYTNKQNKPTKFIALGRVHFKITTKKGDHYEGNANKVIYKPQQKVYEFFENVHLKQLGSKKEILGDEVVLRLQSGKAYAKGVKSEPVIMIFDIPDTNSTHNEEKK